MESTCLAHLEHCLQIELPDNEISQRRDESKRRAFLVRLSRNSTVFGVVNGQYTEAP